jgi:hypothetical protein
MIACCLSAASPCNHQKRDPFSICDVCQQSHELTRSTALNKASRDAKRLLGANGYAIRDAKRLLEANGYTVTSQQRYTAQGE